MLNKQKRKLPTPIIKTYPIYNYTPSISPLPLFNEEKKTVYIYMITDNYIFNKKYFGSNCYQFTCKDKIYIGSLLIDINSKDISFAHNIIKNEDKDISNEIFFTNKEEYLNSNSSNVLESSIEFLNTLDFPYSYPSVLIKTNIEYNCLITYLEPDKHMCIAEQNIFYTYIENLIIDDAPITYWYLNEKINNKINNKLIIQKLSINILSDFDAMRLYTKDSYSIEEYYIEEYNIAFNTENCNAKSGNYNILFDPITLGRYKEASLIKTIELNEEENQKVFNLISTYCKFELCKLEKIFEFVEKEIVEYKDYVEDK